MIPWGLIVLSLAASDDNVYCREEHREGCFITYMVLSLLLLLSAGLLLWYKQIQESKLRDCIHKICDEYNHRYFQNQYGYTVAFHEYDLGDRTVWEGGDAHEKKIRLKVGVITFSSIPGFHITTPTTTATAAATTTTVV